MYKVKGSKHFGFAIPVRSEEEIKEHLDRIRGEHHAARHHCYAWRLGLDKSRFRANDDGEPSNSAGKPILGQIESFDLTNILIVVVRYFGGTKLGVGGLIDAYRTAARMAIEAGTIVEQQEMDRFRIVFPYAQMGTIMGQLKKMDLPQSDQQFDLTCSLITEIRQQDSPQLIEFFEDLEDCSLEPI
ncbi:MAG: YigZ family protein [Flavobacteriales bacterium]|nr:YigZ family protein [Flavobacteriales bacterium]